MKIGTGNEQHEVFNQSPVPRTCCIKLIEASCDCRNAELNCSNIIINKQTFEYVLQLMNSFNHDDDDVRADKFYQKAIQRIVS